MYNEGLRIRSLDKLKALKPTLVVQNTGEEIIDALRVETRSSFFAIHLLGNADARAMAEFPAWRLSQSETEDFHLTTKLLPGMRGKVPISRGIVFQMMQLNDLEKEHQEKTHQARFETKVHARIIGGSAFDKSEHGAKLAVDLEWVPKEIGIDACKAFLEKNKANVHMVIKGEMPGY